MHVYLRRQSAEPSRSTRDRTIADLVLDDVLLHTYLGLVTILSGPDLCHCFAQRRSARALSRLYDRHLAAAGLNASQFTILSILERHPGVKIADLAKIMVMERTTLVRALKPLQAAGFIGSETGEHGALRLSASAAGLKKIADATPHWKRAQAEFEAAFGSDRAARLREDALAAAAAH